MKKKKLTIALALLGVIALYNSVYIDKLDVVKAKATKDQFDAVTYARTLFAEKIPTKFSKALEISHLTELLESKPEITFKEHSNALGIGNIRYFLTSGKGVVKTISDNYVTLTINQQTVNIATEYVFGNAVRDASGLVDIAAFTNTMDFNNISAEINKIIRKEVIPSFKHRVKMGDTVEFIGAVEFNQKHLNLSKIEIIPILLKIGE